MIANFAAAAADEPADAAAADQGTADAISLWRRLLTVMAAKRPLLMALAAKRRAQQAADEPVVSCRTRSRWAPPSWQVAVPLR